MKVHCIASLGENREMGKHGRLIWSIPADLKHFKDRTLGHPVLMGRKTFESIGRILPKRLNVVLTSQPSDSTSPDLVFYPTLQEALETLSVKSYQDIYVIGGEAVFRSVLPFAHSLILTRIHASEPGADVFFPDFSDKEWRCVSACDFVDSAPSFTIEEWERSTPPS